VRGHPEDQQQGTGRGGDQQDQADEGQPGRQAHRLGFDPAPGDQAVQRDRPDQRAGRGRPEEHRDDVEDLVGAGQAVVLGLEDDGEQEPEEDLHPGLRDADLLDQLAPHAVGAFLLGLVTPPAPGCLIAGHRRHLASSAVPAGRGPVPLRMPRLAGFVHSATAK
jgi:hypothetical protein